MGISVSAYKEEEKLCLKWNDFQENAISAFGTLREDSEFSDVTLACEDGQQVEAHKVILAFSSPFFFTLLRKNKHPHPLIYMRGLKSKDLMAILDFLYYGESNIYQENLDSFLAVADELQLKGLMGLGAEMEVESKKLLQKKKTQKEVPGRNNIQPKPTSQDLFASLEEGKTDISQEGTIAASDYTVAADLQDLDDKIKSMMEISENHLGNKGKARICKVCGKEGQWADIQRHIEA